MTYRGADAARYPALEAGELLGWNVETARRWRTLLGGHPQLLDAACGIYGAADVRGLLQHMFAAELRYAQRLSGNTVTGYDETGAGTLDDLFTIHDRAAGLYRGLLQPGAGENAPGPEANRGWDEMLEFETRSAGRQRASRRKVLLHALMHSMRHWAQLATLAREHGVPAGPQDLLFSSALD